MVSQDARGGGAGGGGGGGGAGTRPFLRPHGFAYKTFPETTWFLHGIAKWEITSTAHKTKTS